MRVRQTPGGGGPGKWRGRDGGEPPERWSPEDHARRGHGRRTDLRFDELPGPAPPVGEETLGAGVGFDEERGEGVPSAQKVPDEAAQGEPAEHDRSEAERSSEPAPGEPREDATEKERIERYERRFREEEAQRRRWRDLSRRAEPQPQSSGQYGSRPSSEEVIEQGPPRGADVDEKAWSGEPRLGPAPRNQPTPGPAAQAAPAARSPATRRQLQRLRSRLGLLAYLSFLVFGFAVLPRAIGDLTQRELPEARLTRDRIGQRLTSLRDRFLLLADDVDDQRRRVEKIRIAYGLAVSMEPLPAAPVDPKAFPASIFRPLIEETARVATMARIEVVDLEAKVAALRAFEAARPEVVALTPALSPLRGEFVLTSHFGYRQSAFTEAQEYHSGVDLAAAVGTPVLAPADGTVAYVGKFPVARDSTWWRLGQVVALRHGDELLSIYGHCDRTKVRRGQAVARGDVLAVIGESGVSANPHLHYAVWRRRPTYDARDRPHGEFEPMDPRLLMLDRQWDDEDELLANAGAGPARSEYEPLPRALR